MYTRGFEARYTSIRDIQQRGKERIVTCKRLDEWRMVLERTPPMRVPATIYANERISIEPTALEQLAAAASLPSVHRVLATPDIHRGYGVPIGSVVATRDVVVPAAVGYDINCGMRLITTSLHAEEIEIKRLVSAVADDIPLGEGRHNVTVSSKALRLLLDGGIPAYLDFEFADLRLRDARRMEEERDDARRVEDGGCAKAASASMPPRAIERGTSQLATLGGGNHFIEFQEVDEVFLPDVARSFGIELGTVSIMIHSGSRGLGHEVGGHFMRQAKTINEKKSPCRELCFLDAESKQGRAFLQAMGCAANFAYLNRQLMTALVRRAVRRVVSDIPLPLLYDVTHNMVKHERHGERTLWVHRKGATRAFPPERMLGTPFEKTGQPVIIPGSMGTSSYILVGAKGSRESLHSVNHGAGRVLSRSAARGRKGKGVRPSKPAAISDQRFKESMKDVYLRCAKRSHIKEEAPDAYKDIDEVIRVVQGAGLAVPVARMRPLAVLKG